MFHACDADGGGDIDLNEFLGILKVDPTLDLDTVSAIFRSVNSGEVLNKDQFCLWCKQMFDDFTDEEYAAQIQELVEQADRSAQSDKLRREWYTCSCLDWNVSCVFVAAGYRSCFICMTKMALARSMWTNSW